MSSKMLGMVVIATMRYIEISIRESGVAEVVVGVSGWGVERQW